MDRARLDKRHSFANPQQVATRDSSAGDGGYPGNSEAYAVRGSQFENFMLLEAPGRAIPAVIAAYTLNDPSSVAIPARAFPRAAGMPRSTPDPLPLTSA